MEKDIQKNGGLSVRKIICILIIILTLGWPKEVLAAEFSLSINVVRQDDGATCGELWYNHKVLWRLTLLTDGAKPVSGSYNTRTTLVTPDIIDGLFLVKIQ